MMRLRLKSRVQSLGLRLTPKDTMSGRYLFLHIMKTGGTSFRRMLISRLGAKAVYPNDADLATRPHGWYPSAQEIADGMDTIREHTVLVGHFPYALRAQLPCNYQVITVIRDPIERSLSQIGEAVKVGEWQGMNPLDLVQDEDFIRSRIANFQTKTFSMPMGDPFTPDYAVGPQEYECALRNLNSCAFVGITELFEASCKQFDVLFGTRLAARVRRDNIGVRRPSAEREEIIKAIIPHVEWDVKLYRAASSFG